MSEEPIEKAENEEIEPVEEASPEIVESIEIEIEKEKIDVDSEFVQQVQADEVNIKDSLVGSVNAQGSVEVGDSLVVSMAAGGDVHLHDGAALMLAAGRDVALEDGGAPVIVAGGKVKADRSFVGLLIAEQAEFGEDSQVLLNTPQAIALGAAVGAVFGLISFLTRRIRGKR